MVDGIWKEVLVGRMGSVRIIYGEGKADKGEG